MEKNDQEDNVEHHEEEESTDEEDSGSEEKENNDEVIDLTYRPHATSSSEEAPTSPAAEMEEGYEVKEHGDEVEETCDKRSREASPLHEED